MKTIYRSFLPSLFALLVVLASCSPEYGAHFAPTKQAPKVAANEKADVAAPMIAQEPTEVSVEVAKRAEETGATAVTTDVAAPVIKPAEKTITAKQQKQVIRELRKKLKGMTKEEREAFKNQVLRQLQEQQLSMNVADVEQGEPRGANNINPVLLTIVTIFIPPLGVFLHQGEINTKFWISLVLTILFYVPGLIYSLLVIFDVI